MALMRPKLHTAVALLFGVDHAGPQQASSKPLTTRFRHKQKQSELGSVLTQAHTKDRAEPFVPRLRNPALLTAWVVLCHKRVQNISNKRFEAFVKALVLRIEAAMLRNQPRAITWLKRPYHNILHPQSLRPARLHHKPKLASSKRSLKESHHGHQHRTRH